jgi:class 3 adenylate cyclase
LFPAGRPDVLCLQTVAPGEEKIVELDLPPGRWFLGPGGPINDVEIEAQETGPDSLCWEPNMDPRAVLGVGRVSLTIRNTTPGRLRVQLAGKRRLEPAVSAAYLATMPEYRKRFGSQVLAPDVRVGVQAMGFLFTDLVGSAAMYSELGDAIAFGMVHEHFGVLEEVVERYGGVRVKTIGDALMCAFHRPGAAALAAVAMLDHYGQWADGLELHRPPGIRIGLHFGPAIAVHSDSAGLDYFGGSVNLAARVEGLARASEVVWTAAVQADSEVEEHVAREGWTVEPFEAEVKGIPGLLSLFRVRSRD